MELSNLSQLRVAVVDGPADDLDQTGWSSRSYVARPVVPYRAIKRALDITISALCLALASPFMLAIWLAVRLDGGPGLYGHVRIGRGNQAFRCLKFRTMVTNADEALATLLAQDPQARAQWEQTQKLVNDPRVTPLGRILRATSLDELPQLINIFRGEMSLVGPRPVVHSELHKFYCDNSRAAYLSIRPGLTGLWQVSGRSDTSFGERVHLDTTYASTASLLLDLKIISKTFLIVLLQRGAY
jgi:lipopolysaccharide/colanic/teichoic acid biosynthesis glycosyltransferase